MSELPEWAGSNLDSVRLVQPPPLSLSPDRASPTRNHEPFLLNLIISSAVCSPIFLISLLVALQDFIIVFSLSFSPCIRYPPLSRRRSHSLLLREAHIFSPPFRTPSAYTATWSHSGSPFRRWHLFAASHTLSTTLIPLP